MARSFSSNYTNVLAGTTMSVVELFKISALGMSTFTYTDANSNVSFSGLTYSPYPIKRGKISFSSDLKIDQTNITMAKNWGIDMSIRKDILAGAAIQINRVNIDLPDSDNVLLFDGEVADIKIDEATIDLRCGTLDFLNLELPKRELQVACNWQLYDSFCGITDGSFHVTTNNLLTTTSNKISASAFIVGATQYLRGGFVVGLCGHNTDLHRHITNHFESQISVLPPFPFDFELTDNVTVAPGCDHSIEHCENKFSNLDNYGGFPYIPNQDQIF